MLREALGVRVAARDRVVQISGDRDAVDAARRVLERLGTAAERREHPTRKDVLDMIADELGEQAQATPHPELPEGRLDVYGQSRGIRARSVNQQRYLDAIHASDLVFAIGPAGTGKTYLAVAAAVHMLKAGRVRKVFLVRPAVEAGEKLGYLPGDLEDKVNPYLRPLFDALHDMMDYHTIRRFLESDVIEVAPLAFMRGRTLNNAVVILDEAQNTTRGQMKMFLTRMGQSSKMIVTGDTTQIDLQDPRESGLVDAARKLKRVPGVEFITLDRVDVVRHQLVQRIIDAYGDEDAAASGSGGGVRAMGDMPEQHVARTPRRGRNDTSSPESQA